MDRPCNRHRYRGFYCLPFFEGMFKVGQNSMNYVPDPNDIQLFDLYYEMCRIEFLTTVIAISVSFITGILIWNLIVRA